MGVSKTRKKIGCTHFWFRFLSAGNVILMNHSATVIDKALFFMMDFSKIRL